ncbi:MAG: IS110 family transposase [Pseudomonadota bacterium]
MRTKDKTQEIFQMINPNAAGIDIGSEQHWVAVPEDRDEQPVRKFGCFTSDLYALADWLKKCHIESVVMESTGVYWIPLFQVLERRGFEVKLVNARHVKNVPGRKTDVEDCQWLQRLHTFGLLSGSFRPEDSICVLRSYCRHRENLIQYASAHIQHMQKALIQMNLQLHKVISDISGLTGMRIIKSILAGEHDPLTLAKMRDPRVKNSVETIAKALEGDYRQEHLFALKQAVEAYEVYQRQIQDCDQEMEDCLDSLDCKVDDKTLPPPEGKALKPRGNAPHFDLRSHLYRVTGVDFTQIHGLDVSSVCSIVSEVGLDPNAFPTVKNFSNWLALCPNNRITGGKVKSSKTRKAKNRAANAFRLAAMSVGNSTSALGGYFRRMRSRCGAPQAITATAHKLARIFYHLWQSGESYQDPGHDYYEQKYKERLLTNIKKRAKDLGYEISLIPIG